MTDRHAEQGLRARREAAAYQGAVEAVFAILIGALLGYWADKGLGTSPWLLLSGFALGFSAFVVRLVRLGRRMQETKPAGSPGSDEQ